MKQGHMHPNYTFIIKLTAQSDWNGFMYKPQLTDWARSETEKFLVMHMFTYILCHTNVRSVDENEYLHHGKNDNYVHARSGDIITVAFSGLHVPKFCSE